MGSIPVLPPPTPVESPLNAYRKAQQAQVEQQQLTAGKQEIQQRQMDMDSQKAIMDSYKQANGDPEQWQKLAAQSGKVKPAEMIKIQEAGYAQREHARAEVAAKGAEAARQIELTQGGLEVIAKMPSEQRQAAWPQVLQQLQAQQVDTKNLPPQYPGDDKLPILSVAVKAHSKMVDESLKQSEIAKNNAQANEAKYKVVNGTLMDMSGPAPKPAIGDSMKPEDWISLVDNVVPGKSNAALNARTKAQVQFYVAKGNTDAAQKAINEAGQQIGAIEKETNPAVINAKVATSAAEARIAQAIKDGSAEDAGIMMAKGLVAPSEIQARSNPSFFVKASQAALKFDSKFNPQRAEAEFSVAKSAANSPFFGSAKSLTDKGGTLDQLSDIGKTIPQHDLPVLNTLEDWQKAATGNGPIAKYAAVALGVADDYAKVMGGGVGSDTSRAQALSLIKANQSPDARKASLEGIRGAVSSQINSRIGNNKVLKNMYGQQQEDAPKGGTGKIIVKAPDGSEHPFDTQAQADQFKKMAGIK